MIYNIAVFSEILRGLLLHLKAASFPFQNFFRRGFDLSPRHAVLFHQFACLPAFAEAILHSDEFLRNRIGFGKAFRNSRPDAPADLVVFGAHDAAALPCDFFKGLGIDGLDGGQVYDRSAHALRFQLFRGHQSFENHEPVRDNRHVAPFLENVRLADFERRFFRSDYGHFSPQIAQVNRPLVHSRRNSRFPGFKKIARPDYSHARQNARQGNVLKPFVCGAVRTDGYACVGAADFDVRLVVANAYAQLVPVSRGGKDDERCREGNFSVQRQSRSDRHHVLLLNAALDKTVGMFFGERVNASAFHDVASQRHHALVLVPYFLQSFSEPVPSGDFVAGFETRVQAQLRVEFKSHVFSHACFHSAPNSLSACTVSSLLGTLPCHCHFPSMNEAPLPITVLKIIIFGLPDALFLALSKAAIIALMSWPLHTAVSHPKFLNFSSNGSISRMSLVSPSI